MTHPEHLAKLKEAAEGAERIKATAFMAPTPEVLAVLKHGELIEKSNAELRKAISVLQDQLAEAQAANQEGLKLAARNSFLETRLKVATEVIEPFAARYNGLYPGSTQDGMSIGVEYRHLRAAADWKTESGEGG